MKVMMKIIDKVKDIWRNNQISSYVIIIIALCFVLLFINNCQPQKEKVVEKVKIEYVIKHDTITIEKPVPIVEYKYKTIRDTFYVESKPIEVEIPISQKVYSDPNYTAYVSGFKPNLDSIRLYRKDSLIYTTIEREITKYRNDYSRWSLGLSGGYALTNKGLSPYIGVSVNYDILRWRTRKK